MKKFTIIYKTYKQDLIYIRYSLMSLYKYLDVSNIEEIIIYVHDKVLEELSELVNEISLDTFISNRIIPVKYDYHGYMKQMEVKCLCYNDCSTEYIVILDSDLLLSNPLNFDVFLQQEKIRWYYSIKNDDNKSRLEFAIWKTAFEDSTLSEQNTYYMDNGFPFIFTKKSLEDANAHFIQLHGCDYSQYIKIRCDMLEIAIDSDIKENFCKLSTVFEEFEYLGWFCMNYSNDYLFLDLQSNNKTDYHFVQHWSHGGITEDYLNNIEKHTKTIDI